MVAAARKEMTEAEFAEIEEPGRYDLVDGELWSLPAAKIPHGRFTARVIVALANVGGNGEVYGGELGFVLSCDRRTILCPDASYVQSERMPDDDDRGFFVGYPDLAVEVISDSERPSRVQAKVARYLEAGTTLVWCVYPDKKQVVVYSNNDAPTILGLTDSLTAEPVLPGFRLELAELFR